jgi:hypothetical protein
MRMEAVFEVRPNFLSGVLCSVAFDNSNSLFAQICTEKANLPTTVWCSEMTPDNVIESIGGTHLLEGASATLKERAF